MLTDMRLFVQSFLGEPAKRGQKWWTWHCQVNKPDKDPSLKVESQGFKCFSCGAGGKSYHFLVKEMGYSSEAARLELGGERSHRRRPDVTYVVGVSPPSPEWRRVFGQHLARSQKELSKVESYLASRGIVMETAAHFGLGYVPVWFPVEDFQTWLAPGVVIPAFAGQVIPLLWSLEVRVLDGGPLKYHRPKGVSEPVPFGLTQLQDRDTLVIVEGSFDALSVWQVARDEVDVLALRGAHNSLRFWQGYLAGYRRVVVATDADRAGDRIAQDLKAQHPTWGRCRPLDGTDLNDMLKGGKLTAAWLLK